MLTFSHTKNVNTIGTNGFIGYKSIKHNLLVIIQMCINDKSVACLKSKAQSHLVGGLLAKVSLLWYNTYKHILSTFLLTHCKWGEGS